MALYLAAGTALTGTTFTEVSDANYARLPVTISGVQQSKAIVTGLGRFAVTNSANVTVIASAFFDASTSGNMLMCWRRTPATYNTSNAITHADSITFAFPDVRYPGGTALTIWPAGVIVGSVGSGLSQRFILAGVTLALSGGVFSHFAVV